MNKQVGSNFAKHQHNLMTMYSEPILVIIDHKKTCIPHFFVYGVHWEDGKRNYVMDCSTPRLSPSQALEIANQSLIIVEIV